MNILINQWYFPNVAFSLEFFNYFQQWRIIRNIYNCVISRVNNFAYNNTLRVANKISVNDLLKYMSTKWTWVSVI